MASSRKPNAGGKAQVACPQCGNQYRVPQGKLDQLLTCTNCKRSFIPKAIGRSTRRASSGFPVVQLIIGVVVLAVIGVVIANLPSSGAKMAPETAVKPAIPIGWSNTRVQAAVEWIQGIATNNDFVVARAADIPALQALLGVSPDGESAEKRTVDALKTSDKTAVFRDFEPSEGELDSEAMATAPIGTMTLRLAPRAGSAYHQALTKKGGTFMSSDYAEVRLPFRMVDQQLKVTGFEVLRQPRVREKPVSSHKPHETIAAPKVVERTFDNKVVKVTESELTPLGHLPETPAEQQKEIDGLIDSMLDLTASGAVANRAIDRLKAIGRPAVPRLLNKMYEIKPKTPDEVMMLGRIDQALKQLSGMAFGFNRAHGTEGIGGSEEERISALKQWYAWWYKYHDQDFTKAIDKEDDETLLMTEAEKKAAKEAAGAAQTTPKK